MLPNPLLTTVLVISIKSTEHNYVKCSYSDYTPREISKTMYRLSFRLPESGEERHIILGMIPEQE